MNYMDGEHDYNTTMVSSLFSRIILTRFPRFILHIPTNT